MSDITNPYHLNEPVASPAFLFGRQEAADWVEIKINEQSRVIILSGQPLIGKTSFIIHAAALQNLNAYNIVIYIPPLSNEQDITTAKQRFTQEQQGEEQAIDIILQTVIEQLTPQLNRFDLLPDQYNSPTLPTAAAIRELFAQANARLGQMKIILYIDDLQLLITEDMALLATFLSLFMPILDECPNLYLALTINQNSLKQLKHPLINGVPTFNLGTLAIDASATMVTQPVKNILRFDYGVTRRIAEINSHHPYYLNLFCHTLLNRQMYNGWVNQRDFDSALAELLDSNIEPFTQIWEQSSWVERAVLAGMSAMQGKHGPMTEQEIIRFLQRQDHTVIPAVVIEALRTLAKRGALVPMGAVSYRFHVELLRFWLREHTRLNEILKEVNWASLATQVGQKTRNSAVSTPTMILGMRAGENQNSSRRSFTWLTFLVFLITFCVLTSAGLFFLNSLDIPIAFLSTTPKPTVTIVAIAGEENNNPTVNPTPLDSSVPTEPTQTPTATPPPVISHSLPVITYMGRDIDQSWQIYVMNSDGTDSTALSVAGNNDTGSTWSFDGQRIAFVSERDGNMEIYVMDTDGQNVINVTRHPAGDWTPAWSPDGSQLAFSSLRDGNWEIFVLDTACFSAPENCPNHLSQITADGNGNISPVWSPDSSRFAYTSKATGNWDVYTMAVDGSDIQQLTTAPESDLSPAWSPDGTQIAFESNRTGNVEIYTIPAGGGSANNISNLSSANDHGPAWSPDGQQLVFYSNREGNWEIISTSLDGQSVVNLTQTPNRDEQTPSWRP